MHVCTDAINSMMINAFYTLEIRGADVPMRINKFQPCLSVSNIGVYFIVMCELSRESGWEYGRENVVLELLSSLL